jgi:hypothetical protein
VRLLERRTAARNIGTIPFGERGTMSFGSTVPMYEVVLRHHGQEDVRITDEAPTVGQTLTIDNRKRRVEHAERPQTAGASRRFICRPLAPFRTS